ncbi:MAG: response regulator [Deltaproteobacteria bacterium]|nr:response regulator [Candidatus Anaeroferrophillacea bacterium]
MEEKFRRVGTVMVIDDDPGSLHYLNRVLSDRGYVVQVFPEGSLALTSARLRPPDIILLDIVIPGMNGYEVCEQFKRCERLKDIPVLFISGFDDVIGKVRAFEAGAADFIAKPFSIDEVEARIESRLENRRLQAQLKRHNEDLESLVQQQVQEISAAQMAVIQALAKLTESRDDVTGHHVERVQRNSMLLAEELRRRRTAADEITAKFVQRIYHAAALHDIGKIGIPDAILRKPGRLTAAEFEQMKTHTTIGAETLSTVCRSHPRSALLRMKWYQFLRQVYKQ